MDKKVERILNLYSRLAEGCVINKADEAARFEVTERSIQGDLEDIRMFISKNTGGILSC
jgi:predicted DNA-binding transcriptional regulator YafY